MIKRFFVAILIIVLSIACSACWNKREPKELAAILSIVYDIDEQGKTSMIAEILDTKGQGAQDVSREQTTKIVKMHGDTAAEGIRDTLVTIDRTVYGAHNKTRIFTERLARNGVKDIIDFFLRDHLTDERPIMLVVKNEDPMILYEADTGLSSGLGTYIDQLSRTRKEFTEYSVFFDTLQFIKDYYCQGKQPVIGVVEAVPDEANTAVNSEENAEGGVAPKYKLIFNGLAVFKQDKMLGYLDKYETRVYNALVGNIKSAYISVPIEGNYIAANCLKTQSTVKVAFEDDRAQIKIDIKKEIMLAQNTTNYDVGDVKQVKIIENAISNHIEKEVAEVVAKVQTEFKSDIFGFGCQFHRNKPKIWNKIKDQWDEVYFPMAQVSVKVDTNVRFGGEIRERFGQRAK